MTHKQPPEQGDDVELQEPTEPKSNLNTILLTIVISVLLAMGGMTLLNSNTLSELKGAMIGRPEFDTRLLEITNKQQDLEKQLYMIKIDLAEGKWRLSSPAQGNQGNMSH